MARKQPSRAKVLDQRTRNDLELAAWNEWKAICSILRCSDEHAVSLKNRMWTSAREKLTFLLESSIPEWKDEYSEEGWKDEISCRFDQYIREGVDDRTGRRLNYKDAIWNVIEENSRCGAGDPPLKVIRGKLTAPKRVLDGVLEKLVKEKGWTPKVLDHRSIKISSLNERIGDEDEERSELIDQIQVDGTGMAGRSCHVTQTDDVSDDETEFIAAKLKRCLTFEESVLLLACSHGISCASPMVVKACGFGSSKASVVLYGKTAKNGKPVPGALEKLKRVLDLEPVRELARAIGEIRVLREVTTVLLNCVCAEKRGQLFLSEMEKMGKII